MKWCMSTPQWWCDGNNGIVDGDLIGKNNLNKYNRKYVNKIREYRQQHGNQTSYTSQTDMAILRVYFRGGNGNPSGFDLVRGMTLLRIGQTWDLRTGVMITNLDTADLRLPSEGTFFSMASRGSMRYCNWCWYSSQALWSFENLLLNVKGCLCS